MQSRNIIVLHSTISDIPCRIWVYIYLFLQYMDIIGVIDEYIID